jgi:hypothetical protein
MKKGEDFSCPYSYGLDINMSGWTTFRRAFMEDDTNASMGGVRALRGLMLFRVCSLKARLLSTGHCRIAGRTLRKTYRVSLRNARGLAQCGGLPRCKPSISDKCDMKRVD